MLSTDGDGNVYIKHVSGDIVLGTNNQSQLTVKKDGQHTLNNNLTISNDLNVLNNLTASNNVAVSNDLSVSGDLIISKASANGIKVDTSTPTYGWRDIIGDVSPKTTGAGSAELAAFRGGSYRAWFYTTNDVADLVYHMPHDYAAGTDLHLHLHWAHNGTAITGSLVVTYGITYSKGHNQANFDVEVAPVMTVYTPDIATVPQYRQRIDEIQISSATPTATQLSSSLLEPDGLILVGLKATTIPTITGGSTNKPAFLTLDIHYQSTNIGTKQRTPDFYT